YTKIGSIRSIGDLPTTNIIEPEISNYSKSYRANCIIYLSIERKMIYFAPRHKKRPITQARKLDMIGFLILD
ncbi:hypothetical protein, partial [Streptococcus pseudopneumoniae]|uniref:hypothetical protein n=1 Tax=Streptococcus pseudopneumoniae TaxID=257758 RepID=UPI00066B11CB